MNTRIKHICNLINDSFAGRVAQFADERTAGISDEIIRDALTELFGDEGLTWKGWRAHKNEIFSIMEDVVNVNLPLAVENSAFFSRFVEIKNGAFGDKNEFTAEDETNLVACVFSGNHWDTDRKKLPGRKTFPLETQWLYIRVYDDLERFLKGTTSLQTMIVKMQEAMRNAVNSRIFAAFSGAATYLPAKFIKTGTYDKLTMADLIQRVETAAQRRVVLAGTRTALSYIADGMDSRFISQSQKEEMARTGMTLGLTGLGAEAVEIPQTFIPGTYDFKIDNKSILVLPDNEKFIKVYFEGDARARDMGYTQTHDQTVDTQIQTKVGVGCVFPTLFGKYEIV